MIGAELLVRTLEEHGVEYIFGVPGDIENTLFAALKDSRIQFFNVRHEQSGAFMADVYHRLTGKLGVCFSTLGPGATNMLTGVANAHQDRSAVLALSGQLARPQLTFDSHQYINLKRVFEEVTKATFIVKRARDMNADISSAIRIAKREKPGPVHVTLPIDVLDEDASGYRTVSSHQELTFNYEVQLREMYDLIKNSNKVTAIAGPGVVRANASAHLVAFLEKYNIPAYTSFLAKGVIPEGHALNCGILSRHSTKARENLGNQDLVILLGYDRIEGVEPIMWEGARATATVDETSPPDGFVPTVEVRAPIRDVLESLTTRLDPVRKDAADIEAMRIKTPLVTSEVEEMFPAHPAYVLKVVGELLGRDDVVVSDVGLHKQYVGMYYPAEAPNKTIFSNGLSSMGFSLPAAIAAQLVLPDQNVVAVTGDGGFQMNLQELATAVEHRLPITILIFNDGGYGMVKDRQLRQVKKTYAAQFLHNTHYAKIAEAYGAKGFRLETVKDLRANLRAAIEHRGVSVVDIPIQQYSDIQGMR